MFHTHSLKQRIARWMVGLVVVVALATSSTLFVAFDGFDFSNARPSVAAPAEDLSVAPVPGPYEMYHMEGAPTAVGKPLAPEVGEYQTPWERYHCSGCP